VGVYAIKLLFVTDTLVEEAAPEILTGLYRRMSPHQVIMLFCQKPSEFFR
jgi:hypothetical protein